MTEIWKPIPGYGGHYEASNCGRIRRKPRTVRKFCSLVGRALTQSYPQLILSQWKDRYGYFSVHIGVNGRKYHLPVHVAVLLAFVGPRPPQAEACHNNGNPSDNRPENLRWDTHFANNQDRKKHGRYAVGAAHAMAKLTVEQVRVIRAAPSIRAAMAETGAKYHSVWDIRHGRSWSKVT